MKVLRRVLLLGAVVAIAYAAWRALAAGPSRSTLDWQAQPFPFPPAPRPHATAHHQVEIPPGVDLEGGPGVEGELVGIEPWTDPVDGVCPASHPVKAKLSSGIFHVPGGTSYERTRADRCYLDAPAAESDGLRPAKR